MNPSGLTTSLLIVLLKCAPSTAMSGGLLWAYLRLQKKGIEVCAEMAKLTGLDRSSQERKSTKQHEAPRLASQQVVSA
jgi:hypothetical protein